MELTNFYAKIPEKLVEAQGKLEESIKSFGTASELYTETFIEYRKLKGEVVKRLKGEGVQVSIIAEIAQGETAEAKGKMLNAEAQKKKTIMLYDAYRERLFTLRSMNRSTEALTR